MNPHRRTGRPFRTAFALAALAVLLPVRPGDGTLQATLPAVHTGSPAEDAATARFASAAPSASAASDLLVTAFRNQLGRMLGTGSRTERWGLLVVSLDRGDTVFAVNAHEAMAPASNMKLFTSAAALHILGPETRLPTYLLADGPVVDGVLEGNLILYGTGDPTLGSLAPERPSQAYATFLAAVRAAGIREVRGAVLGDGSHFTGDPRRPSWNPNDLDNWFAAPASALTFNENMVTLRVAPERAPGLPTTVRTIPEGAGVPIRNESRVTSGGGANLAMVRNHPDGVIRVVGAMRPRQVEAWRSMTVSDPPSYAASVLRATLEAHGIRVQGGHGNALSRGRDSRISGRLLVAPAFGQAGELRTLAVHHSDPVAELIHPVNKRSHNLFAENLLLAMGRVAGEEPSFDGGSFTLERFLVDRVGVDGGTLHVEDGSGLSRLNRTSAAGIIRLLEWVETSPFQDAFLASLPEAGNRRELARMNGSPAAGNLRAKTGTINRTSALSGVVAGADGERLLFSILVNDVPSTWAAKRIEDRIGIHLAGFRRGEVPDLTPVPVGSIPVEAGADLR
jgi:serine-type D-Ala-D-Ala carboxypeptidase/endopeptidase (penicillin-binding protein 4)